MATTAESDRMGDLTSQSLHLVNRELKSTFETAKAEIEDFVEGRSDKEALLRAAGLLHLASGVLNVVEISGAALLAEEMEETCRCLAELEDEQKKSQAIEALTRSMAQLPAYLDRLIGGGKDIALILLPLLNDLRKVRGRPLLSEGTILLLKSSPMERVEQAPAVDYGTKLQKLAQKLRPPFQAALLGVLRGEDFEANLDTLIDASSRLAEVASAEQVKQLWSVLSGVLVALRTDGLDASVALKRLIGQADRQLKRLIDIGETAVESAPPIELLNDLLYYIVRAESEDPRLVALRESFGFEHIVLGEQLEEARESLAGPSAKLMQTVAEAIKKDLGTVKNALEDFVRDGMRDARQLRPQLEILIKIADTLGVLGLREARKQIQAETRQLNMIAGQGELSDHRVLDKIAATLLAVEDDLDAQLVRAAVPADEAESTEKAQYRHVTQAVMGECMVNLTKIKEAVVKLIEEPGNVQLLDQIKPQIKGITAGLLMLNKSDAAKLVERIGATIFTHLASGDARGKLAQLERLADAIVSLEYFMETVQVGRGDPVYMLDNAKRCLALLENLPAPEAPAPAKAAAPPARPSPPPVMDVEEGGMAPELVEVFIEEAKEEIASIRKWFPAGSERFEHAEALNSVRRSFHTLKGSGRMVGARLIGEFAWSIENLLNRIINKTLAPNPAMIAFVDRAVDALPALVEQLESGIAPDVDVQRLMAQAQAFAEGDPDAATRSVEAAPESADAAAESESAGMDPVLMEIFLNETRSHLATIQAFIADTDVPSSGPHAVDESLYRAGHTLLGSARMANCPPAIELAEPLDRRLDAHYRSGTGLTADELAVLRELADAIGEMLRALSAGKEYTADRDMLARAAAVPVPGRESAGRGPEPAAEAPAVGFDPEIAAIFSEEAVEILDQAESAVQELSSGGDPAVLLPELQRLLHTLKGGARMAGVTAMGDLSHAMETFLASLSDGRVAMHQTTAVLIRRCVDELHRMRESIDAGGSTDDLSVLVRQIEMATDGEVVDQPPPSIARREARPEVEAEPAEELVAAAPASVARSADRTEMARVDAELLNLLLNNAGEINIFQSRLGQQLHSIDANLSELDQTVTRLRAQLRNLEVETEAQILHGHQDDAADKEGFDPLELDRYSTIQQLSRALAETSNDVGSIGETLHGLAREAENLLAQQTRVTTELQDGLMQTRMVSLQRHVPRLERIVRQVSADTGKLAALQVEGANSELDRQVLNSILPALEHLLRNAVVHGIEKPEIRRQAGKTETGAVHLILRRDGSEVLIELSDDGAGLDLEKIQRIAREQKLIPEGRELSEDEAIELIFKPGLSTAGELTQAAGRGVGMDVVDNEVKKLGGSMRVESKVGEGTRFLLRLPYTLAITQALIVNVGDETFALPLLAIEGITRVKREQLLDMLTEDQPKLDYGDVGYRIQHLGSLVGAAPSQLPEDESSVALVLVRAGEHSTALLADSLEGTREIVVKTLGPHIASVRGVSGATILADGRIVAILDPDALVRTPTAGGSEPAPDKPEAKAGLTALVVDDSITMRRVTQRILERHGMRVLTARDGLDAISVLQEHEPDIILLDIEMPRMDGYQFAKHVRNDAQFEDLPIIMITSRSGKKHRARAIELGVNDYLGKPYQEDQLIKAIGALLGRSL